MDSVELIGVIAVSFVPFLVSIGPALFVGGRPRKWPFLAYAFSLLAGFLAGKGFGVLLWSISWMMAWVFAGIALRTRGVGPIGASSPEDADAEGEAASDPPDDEASRLPGSSSDQKVG